MNLVPSIICADQLNLNRDLELLHSCGIKRLHIDIMDGNFVPRYGFFPEILCYTGQIRLRIRHPFDGPQTIGSSGFIIGLKRVKNVAFIFNQILILTLQFTPS